MKKHVRILSVLMALVLLLSLSLVSVSAVRAPVTFGNVDHQNGVDVMDATIIQRTVAKISELNGYSAFAADVDNDTNVTILDATMIQQFLAGIITEFPAGVSSFVDVYAEALISDYGSGKARVGTPVTFTALATGHAGPLMYEFYVNDEVVREYSTDNTYVHDFEEPGSYEVYYLVKNRAGIEVGEGMILEVTDPMDLGWVNISSVYHKGFYDSLVTFEAIAKDGLEPYEFSFALYDITKAKENEFGTLVEQSDFSESNSFTLSEYLTDYNEYTLYVTVRDSNGQTDTTTLTFTYMTPPPA